MEALKSDKLPLETGALVLLLAGFVLLFGMIVTSPNHLLYDEPYHLETLNLAKDIGWKRALQETQSATGPLYAGIHYGLSSITKLNPIALRIANLALLIGLMAATVSLARKIAPANSVIRGLSLLAIPFVWPPSGMALTEVPSTLFLVLFLLFAVHFLTQGDLNTSQSVLLGLGAGVCLGLAVLGRQTNLAVGLALVALKPWSRTRIYFVATLLIVTGLVCGWLFLLWGGIAPPQLPVISKGLKPQHLILSFAYLGVASAFINPRAFLTCGKRAAFAICLVLVVTLIFPVVDIAPALGLIKRLLGEGALLIYRRVGGALLTTFSFLFAFNLAKCIWDARAEETKLFLTCVLLALSLPPLAVSHQFSSRYVVAAAPVLVVLAFDIRSVSLGFILRVAAGISIGAGSLWSYYRG